MVLGKVTEWSEDKQGLYFILFISAILKVLVFWALSDKPINPDGVLYISAAQQFAAGHFKEGMALYPMPLYPALIAIVHLVIPHWVMAARLISYTSLVLLVIPLYYLINHLFGRGAAFWGCFAFVLAPIPNGWVVDVIRGPSFVFVFAWAVYFALLAVCSKGIKYFFIAAFFGWLAVCLRIEGIIFVPFYFLFLIGLAISKNRERPYFLKGILIWIIFPLLLSVFFLVFFDIEIMSYNRGGEVWLVVKDIFHLKFLNNYHQIYQQLKALEASSPFTGLGKQNVVAIARHYMPIIYLFGLFESLIKVLFPFFVIPLFLGLRNSLLRTRVLVLILVIFYLIVVYYYAIKLDFVRTRFLFAPAFLLYPWIGAGLERMFILLRQASKPKFFAVVFVSFFIILPLCKVGHSFGKHDGVIIKTGEWLAAQAEFNKAKIATNEARILFYAGKESWAGGTENFYPYASLRYDYKKIGQLAREKERDILIIRSSVKKKDKITNLGYFKKIKEFIGKKDVAIIYCSPKFSKTGRNVGVTDYD
jgi:hypothetical protein